MDPDIDDRVVQSKTAYADIESKDISLSLEYGDRDGYILDAAQLSHDQSTKLTRDGRTVLIPQPSDHPDDPLNWSQTKKHVLLAILCACTFLPDYGSVTGAVTLIPQAKYIKPFNICDFEKELIQF